MTPEERATHNEQARARQDEDYVYRKQIRSAIRLLWSIIVQSHPAYRKADRRR